MFNFINAILPFLLEAMLGKKPDNKEDGKIALSLEERKIKLLIRLFSIAIMVVVFLGYRIIGIATQNVELIKGKSTMIASIAVIESRLVTSEDSNKKLLTMLSSCPNLRTPPNPTGKILHE